LGQTLNELQDVFDSLSVCEPTVDQVRDYVKEKLEVYYLNENEILINKFVDHLVF